MTPIVTTLVTNGDSTVLTFEVSRKIGMFAGGNFGTGGSIQPQISPDGVLWINLGSPITADGGQVLDVPPCQFKCAMTGATVAADVDISITR